MYPQTGIMLELNPYYREKGDAEVILEFEAVQESKDCPAFQVACFENLL